ncbi:SRPBCC family protein [Amnibacterium setariae]|uniref:Polyketide cyclase n=1 Tax=Amnibacterium setariae TaxID=2306585 RepID=A0A3A1TTZ5_9MICO|nr:SRPBCC family protein [Amnibacterium setariae]RIX27693.1 polyketide cyclase [Amnibacterium setariae]
MWTTRHEAETDADPGAVWAAIEALKHGARWSDATDAFELHGPFAVGTRITVTPAGQDAMTSVITELVPGERYADRTDFQGLALTFRHALMPLADGGTRVTHVLEIDGDGADEIGPELGPRIASDFPAAMDELLAAAAGARAR